MCRYVQMHHPADDVEYKPGVDVEGRPVVEADLNPSGPDKLEEQIVIMLTSDVAKVFGLRVPEIRRGRQRTKMVDANALIGYLTLKDGHAYLNGKPLDKAANRQLAVLCSGAE